MSALAMECAAWEPSIHLSQQLAGRQQTQDFQRHTLLITSQSICLVCLTGRLFDSFVVLLQPPEVRTRADLMGLLAPSGSAFA